LHQRGLEAQRSGRARRCGAALGGGEKPRQVRGDGGVVGRGAGIDLGGQAAAQLECGVAVGPDLGDHLGVISRVGHDGHRDVVLGRAAEHGRAADVNVLDDLGKADAGFGHGGLEGVQVHHHQVNRTQVVPGGGGLVLGVVTQVEQPAVHPGVKGLDPPVEDFGKPGELAQLGDGQPGQAQRAGRPAGREQLRAQLGHDPGQVHDAGLVVHGEEGAANHSSGVLSPAGPLRVKARAGAREKSACVRGRLWWLSCPPHE